MAVYLDFWDAIVLASAEMDPEHPALEEHAVDQALELAQLGVQGVVDGARAWKASQSWLQRWLLLNPVKIRGR
ncbi:hypothetical protein HFP72_30835 [Nocardiopsis sp. ARC36]